MREVALQILKEALALLIKYIGAEARQIVTPFGGDVLEKIGILKEN